MGNKTLINKPVVFQYDHYKSLLKDWIAYSSEIQSGYQGKLAKAIKAPASFLSQVIHTKVQFTPEHALRCSAYWGLDRDEQNYFLNLIHFERAGSPDLRAYHSQQLKALKVKHEDFGNRNKGPELSEGEASWIYYTHWTVQAVHLFLMVPQFQILSNLAQRTGRAESELLKDLQLLQALGLAEHEKGRWKPTQATLHLSRQSTLSPVNHMLWRQKASAEVMKFDSENLHYTGLHCLAKADVAKIRALISECLDRAQQVIKPSAEEEVVALTVDLFRL